MQQLALWPDVKMAQTGAKKGGRTENLYFSLVLEGLHIFTQSSIPTIDTFAYMTPTTTEIYTGPGVLPAENADQRNTIIIAVVCTVVALSLVAGVVFMLLHRRNPRSTDEQIEANVTFPSIQADLLYGHTTSVFSPNRSTADIDGLNAVLPQRPLSPEEVQEQEDIKTRFRIRQATFKSRRDEMRESQGGTDGQRGHERTTYIAPSSTDEEEIFSILNAHIEYDIVAKGSLYRDLLRQWHPDKNRLDGEKATRVFQYLQSNKTWFLGANESSP